MCDTGIEYGLQAMKGTLSAVIRQFKILPGSTPLSLDYKIMLKRLTGMKAESRHPQL
jgi:hypothetical protein